MTVDELIAAARIALDDRTEPYLWPDADLTAHAADAEKEAAIRADLLYDDGSKFLHYTLADGVDRYTLDSRVWRIDRAWLVLTGRARETPLTLTGVDQLHPAPNAARCGCWPTDGRPQAIAQLGQTIRLWPTPTASDTGILYLGAYRTPLFPMEVPGDAPEIGEVHHMGLVDWMLYRAFNTKDSEMYDPKRAADHMALFVDAFGERPDAQTHRRRNERRRVTARYGGY